MNVRHSALRKIQILTFSTVVISNAASHMLLMPFTRIRFCKNEWYNGVWKTCACSVS